MARFKWTRDFFKPKEYDEKITESDLGIEIYKYTVNRGNGATQHAAMGFGGKRQKPDFHYTFLNEDRRAKHIENYMEGQRANKRYRIEQKQKRVKFEHDYEIDDILYCTWGYEQTNVDFYQVLSTTRKTITIREICGAITEHDGARMYSGKCVARKDEFKDNSKPMRKLVQPGGYITMNSYSSASKWDGKPLYFSNDY